LKRGNQDTGGSQAEGASMAPAQEASGSQSPNLSHEAVRGTVYTIAVSVGGKLVTVASQIGLAWFLVPKDMGLVAMTMSVVGLVSVIAGSNLGSMLIQRQARFAEIAGQVFWLALLMNTVGAVIAIAVAPLTQRLFGEAGVAPLLVVVALASPFMALPTIYSAALSCDLKFGALSWIQFVQGLVQNGCALGLAAAGFGPYSLVLPLLVTSALSALMYRRAAGRIPIPAPAPAQWWPLLASSSWLMLNTLFTAVRSYGPSFAIAVVIKDSVVTGFYYWGFSLAFQAIFLLAANLQSVFFPTLIKLNDSPDRQFAAFRKVCLVLGIVAVVVCVLQVLLARPLISLLFHERWERAIPVVQWLSIGILSQPLNTLATSLLLARGRFGVVAAITAFSGVSVTLAAAVGASMGQEAEIAQWTGLSILVTNLISGWFGYRVFERGWGCLMKDLLPLVGMGVPMALLGWAGAGVSSHWSPPIQMVTISLAVAALGLLLVKLFMPEIALEMVLRLKPLWRGFLRPS
jgi:lipopolysaccharide exporter